MVRNPEKIFCAARKDVCGGGQESFFFFQGSKMVKIGQNWPAEFRHRPPPPHRYPSLVQTPLTTRNPGAVQWWSGRGVFVYEVRGGGGFGARSDGRPRSSGGGSQRKQCKRLPPEHLNQCRHPQVRPAHFLSLCRPPPRFVRVSTPRPRDSPGNKRQFGRKILRRFLVHNPLHPPPDPPPPLSQNKPRAAPPQKANKYVYAEVLTQP